MITDRKNVSEEEAKDTLASRVCQRSNELKLTAKESGMKLHDLVRAAISILNTSSELKPDHAN